MFNNYLKIALRNLARNSVYSFINITGLSIGIACSLLISLWVVNEVSYDRFHPNIDRLYQVLVNAKQDENLTGTWHDISLPVYQELKTKFSQIKNATLTDIGGSHLLTTDNKRLYRPGFFVSPEFLQVFQFELIQGSANQLLNDPSSIVLTASTAKALFGEQDPMNKVIKIDNQADVKVMGILKDIPHNSSIKFDYLLTSSLFLSLNNWGQKCENTWACYSFAIYVELQPEADVALVNDEIRSIITDQDNWIVREKKVFLYPLARKHLHDDFENGKEATSDWSEYVVGLSYIALGIIIIACINFMNLSTARSERRAREVGIRKIVGSRRKELIYQFIGESILISVIAFLFALVLTELSLPLYNDLVQKRLFIDYTSPLFWGLSFGMVTITGIFAGSYPAFYLSAFNPVKVLKGKAHIGRGAILPRKILVVLQFSFSVFLIVGTIVIHQQTQYARERHPGYNKQNLITLESNHELMKNYQTIKQELIRTGAAVSVTTSNSPITQIYEINYLSWPGNRGQEIPTTNIFAEYDYIKTMGIKIIDGRNFSENIKSDSDAVILNEKAVNLMGLEKPIGSTVTIGGDPKELIGITEDIIMSSPYEDIDPMYIVLETEWKTQANTPHITIRLTENNDVQAQLKKAEAVFKKYNSAYPFQYSFVDSDYNKRFYAIYLIGTLTNTFASLAIFIASMGLFGLAAFTAERRTKEFGVRKVLGASVSNLVGLITKDFTKLIMISFLISSPIAWWALNKFLERYSYRISIDWWILPAAGCAVLLLSLGIICTQAIRAAFSNPVEALKNE